MTPDRSAMARNVALYPWHHFLQNLLFWQATWFLYFQTELSAAHAILLYAIYDVSVTVLEVPSGYMSDRVGRRITLVWSAIAVIAALCLLTLGGSFFVLAAGQVLLGVGMAFNSGTDTALLYQSLAACDRRAEMETQSLRAWRFSFIALMLSALTGGVMALWSEALPFAVSGLAMVGVLIIALRFGEPLQTDDTPSTEWRRMLALAGRFRQPVLAWLFALGVLMYGFSHIPFVFGQPFIAEALAGAGFTAEAPVVSGTVTMLMMGLSVLVSLIAPAVRRRIGLGALLLVAFGLQIGLAAVLAVSGTVVAIAVLLLRMVPDSLSTPFILARLQPLLSDDSRATFLSIKSFLGRLLFAGSLWLAARSTTNVGEMPLSDLQSILGLYAIAGAVCIAVLGFLALRLRIDTP